MAKTETATLEDAVRSAEGTLADAKEAWAAWCRVWNTDVSKRVTYAGHPASAVGRRLGLPHLTHEDQHNAALVARHAEGIRLRDAVLDARAGLKTARDALAAAHAPRLQAEYDDVLAAERDIQMQLFAIARKKQALVGEAATVGVALRAPASPPRQTASSIVFPSRTYRDSTGKRGIIERVYRIKDSERGTDVRQRMTYSGAEGYQAADVITEDVPESRRAN